MDFKKVESIAETTLSWSLERDLQGHNKHDGLNSPILRAFLGWSKWLRIIGTQIVTRSPINLRPLLLIPSSPNPKGLSLFLRGVLLRFRATQDELYKDNAMQIIQKLDGLKKNIGKGIGWGYYYPWQDPGFYAEPGLPNAVVTSFVCQSLMDAYEALGKEAYLEDVSSAIDFFFSALPVLKNEDAELCLGYMPVPMKMRVMDVSILIASVIARYNKITGESKFADSAHRLANYVVNRQTQDGAWFYTDPPGDSHITHDNYHTGFILDAIEDFSNHSGINDWSELHKKGLEFYHSRLFNKDASPRWMHNINHPYDIHGAAQGVITFSRHQKAYPGFSNQILDWTLSNLYNTEGHFYYQQNKFFTKKFTLMRWCNAWMYFAMCQWLEVNRLSSMGSEYEKD